MSLYAGISNSPDDAVAMMRKIALFRSLDDEQLGQIAPQLMRRAYGAGVTLFHQGMPGSSIYIIEEGSVRVFAVGLTGQEHTFTTFGPDNFFGELSVIDGKPRTASAITLEQSVVWLLSKDLFNRILADYPSVCRTIAEVLAGRVRRSATHVEAIIFQDVLGRVAYEILTLADRHGQPVEDGVQIEMPLTQSDLASIVGATRESVNKALATLRKRELLEMEGTSLLVLKPEKMMDLVGSRGR